MPAGVAYALDSAGNVSVYHTDGLGSVRALTDAAGNVTQTYRTDAFGVPVGTESSNPPQQPITFTGAQHDYELQLVDLGARSYFPAIGRFLQRDPVDGDAGLPLSLNRFAYARNNPATLTDPSGLTPTNRALKAPNCLDPTTNCGGMGPPTCLPLVGCVSLAGIIKEFGKHGDEGAGGNEAPTALPEARGENPWSGPIQSVVTQQEIVLYRVWGGDPAAGGAGRVGRWLTPVRPEASSAARSGLALPPGNTATYVSEVRIPAGTRIQIGAAAPAFGQSGGWTQALVLGDVSASWFGPGETLEP